MFEFIRNWTKEEFRAYLFIFCAHADFVEAKEEVEAIKSNISEETFLAIHKEFDEDNDYQQIQKITANAKKFYTTQEQIDELFVEIKALLLSDGKMDILEENMFRALKHQLSKDS